MNALVIINRGGGSVDNGAVQRVRESLKAAGVAADIAEVDGREITVRAKDAVKSGVELVIAAGGDGTVSAVASALFETRTSLGVIPLGTLNHFAKDLGIPTDVEKACALLSAGKPQSVDLAEVDGRVFINNSAIGLYPLMVLDRESQQKRLGRSKRLAMIVASVRTLARFHHHRLTLTVNTSKKAVSTPLLFVGNNDYQLALGGAGTRKSLSDGHLCVYILRSHTRLGMFAAMLRSLIGLTRDNDMIKLQDVKLVKVSSHRTRLAVSLDGEVCHLPTPLEYRILPGALRVIAP